MFMPSQCTSTCGDGTVDAGVLEQCDDGNATDGDRCSASCELEHTLVEEEPNGDVAEAQPIEDGDVLLGSIQPTGDLDLYELVLVEDSFVLLETYATIDGDPLNGGGNAGPLGDLTDCPVGGDTDLFLYDDTSNVFDQGAALFADDQDGGGFCAFLGPNADPTLLTAGTYYVRINEFAGGAMEHYVLDVRVQPPLSMNDACSPANDTCDPTQGLFCEGSSSTCQVQCGNGEIDANEECDDGDLDDGDRCNSSCLLNADVVDNGNNDAFATAQPLASGEIARGSLDDTTDLWDLYTFTLTNPSWVIMELYTTVDGDTGNYTGNGLDPELDCDENIDIWLYDGTGDPSDTATAWQYAFSDGDGNCDFFGPPSDEEWAYLPPGTYYVEVREGGTPDPVERYALDLQIVPALTTGDTCNPSFDLCHPLHEIACDGTNTCFPLVTDRTSHQIFNGDFDLQNTRLTMSPGGGTYDVVATAAGTYPDTPGTGTVSTSTPSISDEDWEEVANPFPFYGTTYPSLFINSNGNITFTEGEILTQAFYHFDLPRISWLFVDLDPGAGGTVTVDRFADRLTVTFDQVPRYNSTNVVEAQIQLFDTGIITITHLATTQANGTVGISAGDALGTWPDETDFSSQQLRAAMAGDLVINEILADPTGVDSNCDGAFDAAQDELVELVNIADVPVDLSGVTLSDATGVRYTFGAMTLGAGRAVVVYGGGVSQCPDVVGLVGAGLDLDDAGDTVTVSTGDSVNYGASSAGLSQTRDPDKYGPFVSHDAAIGSSGNLSPSFRLTGNAF
jgi:cysteine-rich repeat protein